MDIYNFAIDLLGSITDRHEEIEDGIAICKHALAIAAMENLIQNSDYRNILIISALLRPFDVRPPESSPLRSVYVRAKNLLLEECQKKAKCERYIHSLPDVKNNTTHGSKRKLGSNCSDPNFEKKMLCTNIIIDNLNPCIDDAESLLRYEQGYVIGGSITYEYTQSLLGGELGVEDSIDNNPPGNLNLLVDHMKL